MSTNPFAIYSTEEERLVAYVIREHRRGRDVCEILDSLVDQPRRRSTCEQRRLLLSRPDLIRAVVEDVSKTA
jgi:hypothetical protein